MITLRELARVLPCVIDLEEDDFVQVVDYCSQKRFSIDIDNKLYLGDKLVLGKNYWDIFPSQVLYLNYENDHLVVEIYPWWEDENEED